MSILVRKVFAGSCYTRLKSALIHLFDFFVEFGLKYLGFSDLISSQCSLVEVISDGCWSLLYRLHIHYILRLSNFTSIYIIVALMLLRGLGNAFTFVLTKIFGKTLLLLLVISHPHPFNNRNGTSAPQVPVLDPCVLSMLFIISGQSRRFLVREHALECGLAILLLKPLTALLSQLSTNLINLRLMVAIALKECWVNLGIHDRLR